MWLSGSFFLGQLRRLSAKGDSVKQIVIMHAPELELLWEIQLFHLKARPSRLVWLFAVH